MDHLSGDILLSDLHLDLGIYDGNLPVMMTGRIRLPWNGQVGNPNSFHQHLLRGQDYTGVTGYICACGEAFLGFSDAYDHFFKSYRGPMIVKPYPCTTSNFHQNSYNTGNHETNPLNDRSGAHAIVSMTDESNETIPNDDMDIQHKDINFNQSCLLPEVETNSNKYDSHNFPHGYDKHCEKRTESEENTSQSDIHPNKTAKLSKKHGITNFTDEIDQSRMLKESDDDMDNEDDDCMDKKSDEDMDKESSDDIDGESDNDMVKESDDDMSNIGAQFEPEVLSNESDSHDSIDDDLCEETENCQQSKRLKPVRRRLLAEALFILFGLPKHERRINLYAAEMKLTRSAFRRMIRAAGKRKSKVNPYKKLMTAEIYDEVKKMHAKIKIQLVHDKARVEGIIAVLCAKHGSLHQKYRRILARKLSVTFSQLDALYDNAVAFPISKNHLKCIPVTIQQEAETLDASIVLELQQLIPPVSPTCLRFTLTKARLIMEAMWEKYGLDYSMEFREKCATELGVSDKTLNDWWKISSIHFKTVKKSYYNKQLTDDIREKAEEIHDSVMNSLEGNHERSRRIFAYRGQRERLVVEGIFKLYGTDLSKQFRDECASEYRISKAAVSDYWRQAKMRNEQVQENPFAHLLTDNILCQSKDLYAKVTCRLEEEQGSNK